MTLRYSTSVRVLMVLAAVALVVAFGLALLLSPGTSLGAALSVGDWAATDGATSQSPRSGETCNARAATTRIPRQSRLNMQTSARRTTDPSRRTQTRRASFRSVYTMVRNSAVRRRNGRGSAVDGRQRLGSVRRKRTGCSATEGRRGTRWQDHHRTNNTELAKGACRPGDRGRWRVVRRARSRIAAFPERRHLAPPVSRQRLLDAGDCANNRVELQHE